ncbi:hypothetical protein AB3X92_40665 [Paraburkholderia sp. BR14317]|uniref:hypothetical protein n=1 Tax=Paraburkholderia sp. BR14262 TaxID=3236999 RepID=UPI0034CD932B
MRYALCSATDQLLSMLGDWVRKAIRIANDRGAASRPDLKAQLREFATAVKALAGNRDLTRDVLARQLCELADTVLKQDAPSRTRLMPAQLVSKRRVAHALLAQLLDLPFQAQTAHPVMDALALLRERYPNKAVDLPADTQIPLGRAWQRMIAMARCCLASRAWRPARRTRRFAGRGPAGAPGLVPAQCARHRSVQRPRPPVPRRSGHEMH